MKFFTEIGDLSGYNSTSIVPSEVSIVAEDPAGLAEVDGGLPAGALATGASVAAAGELGVLLIADVAVPGELGVLLTAGLAVEGAFAVGAELEPPPLVSPQPASDSVSAASGR